jgi:hypothetical protein
MAFLLTEMDSAFQLLATRKSASYFGKVATLILQRPFPADTLLLNEIRTWWATFVVFVAGVLNRRVPAILSTIAGVVAFRRPSTTWLGWHEFSTPASAADLMEYGVKTASTWTFVAEVGAVMSSALERFATLSSTDMFSFHLFDNWRRV